MHTIRQKKLLLVVKIYMCFYLSALIINEIIIHKHKDQGTVVLLKHLKKIMKRNKVKVQSNYFYFHLAVPYSFVDASSHLLSLISFKF